MQPSTLNALIKYVAPIYDKATEADQCKILDSLKDVIKKPEKLWKALDVFNHLDLEPKKSNLSLNPYDQIYIKNSLIHYLKLNHFFFEKGKLETNKTLIIDHSLIKEPLYLKKLIFDNRYYIPEILDFLQIHRLNNDQQFNIAQELVLQGMGGVVFAPEAKFSIGPMSFEKKVELIYSLKQSNRTSLAIQNWDQFNFSNEELVNLPIALLQYVSQASAPEVASATKTQVASDLIAANKNRNRVFKDTKKSELLGKILTAINLGSEEKLFEQLIKILTTKTSRIILKTKTNKKTKEKYTIEKKLEAYKYDNQELYFVLQAIFNIIILLPNEVKQAWLETGEDPQAVFSRHCVFSDGSPEWSLRFSETFGSFRNPATIFSYLSNFETYLPDDFKKIAIKFLHHFVDLILSDKFQEARYDTKGSPHLAKVFSIPGIKELWLDNGQPQRVRGSDSRGYTLSISDDPKDLLMLGDEVQGSCMASNSLAGNNIAIFSNLLNGEILPIILKADGQQEIAARALLRLLWNDSEKKPILLLEPPYKNFRDPALDLAIEQRAIEKATQLRIPLLYKHPSPSLVTDNKCATFLGGYAPFIYTDTRNANETSGLKVGRRPYTFLSVPVIYKPPLMTASSSAMDVDEPRI